MPRILNFLLNCSYLPVLLVGAFLLPVSSAQNGSPVHDSTHQQNRQKGSSATADNPAATFSEKENPQFAEPSALVLGPGDEIEVVVYGASDLGGHTRVNSDGDISMPLVGYVRVSGLTSSEAEAAIENQLRKDNILNDPHVSVFVKEYISSGVSVAGEVVKPGSYSILGPHRFFDVLQEAGGLTEKAANRAVISHRGGETPVTVELSKDPEEMSRNNVEIRPGDTVVVPPAPIVYVLGEVNKPGGYILNSTNGVTLLRVVAAAGGPTRGASVGGTKMLRSTPNGLRELQVPLKKILHAKAPDMPVQGGDIIYVPTSGIKTALNATALTSALGTVALYRIPF